jgi:beta-phosphoglucomutase
MGLMGPMTLGAVIFDFDGVITDSEILHFRAFNAVLSKQGFELTKQEYYRDYLGIEESQIQELVQQKTKVFEHLARTEGKIIEGVREFLQMLSQNRVPTAICSGALRAEIELILDGAKLRSYFKVVVSAEEVKRGKPDPQGFLLALKKLNKQRVQPIASEHCVVIEDSHWGLQAAKAAHMRTVAVTNTFEADQLTEADKVVNRLTDLTIQDLTQLCS